MKLIIQFMICSCLIGCSHVDSPTEVQVTRIKVALTDTLLYGLIAVKDNSKQIQNVEALRNDPEIQRQIATLKSYGQSNIFLNPDLELWTSTNQCPPQEFAIILHGFKGHYLGIRFDGALVETQNCSIKWLQ